MSMNNTKNGSIMIAALIMAMVIGGLVGLFLQTVAKEVEYAHHSRIMLQLISHAEAGIDTAVATGFDRIRINAVVMKGRNDDEAVDLVAFARERGIDIAFIEEMPLGAIAEHDRGLSLCTSADLHRLVSERFALESLEDPGISDGPARFCGMRDSRTRVGFISPHSNNFCHLCNRVRVTVEGRLLLCLGNEHSADLRAVLRSGDFRPEHLDQAIIAAVANKPERHYFELDGEPEIVRFMNMTGG